jgi:hypothetical protein
MDNIHEEEVTYKEWKASKETNTQLVSTTQHVTDFIPKLINLLKKLVTHHFINKSQNKYFKKLKSNIGKRECVILLDFAENYSPVIHDEVQAAHWQKTQVTLHPFVIYYKGENDEVAKHKSYCVLSDYLKHDAESVHTFIKELIPKLKELIIGIDAIHFFSDGGPAHYKNKYNFANLSFFEKEYSMKVRWNFWASGHGKNACDGIDGSTKRQFRLASLRGEMLITCQQLLEWAESNIPSVTFMLISKEVVETNSLCILPRIEAAQMIKGTRQFHCFIPGPQGVLFASDLSNSSLPSKKFVVVKSTFVPIDLSTISIGHFLVVYRESQWWVTKVDHIEANDGELNVIFFEPSGSESDGKSFTLSNQPIREEVITSVDVIFNLRESLVRRSKASNFFDLPDTIYKVLKNVVNEYHFFKDQQ